jgi:hypothetical protein
LESALFAFRDSIFRGFGSLSDTLFPLDDRQQRLLAGEAVVVSVRQGKRADPLAAWARERGLLIYIGRATRGGWPQSDWHNPFLDSDAIRQYEENLRGRPDLLARLGKLRGRALGCWCWPRACHGDVLAGLVNAKKGDVAYP